MLGTPRTSLALLLLVSAGCRAPAGNTNDSGEGTDASSPTDAGTDAGFDAGTPTDAGLGSGNCFPATETLKDGRFGTPQTTFTIPASAKQSDGTLYLVDIQQSYPQVDWQALDRLYIPAGQYSEINIHNLPIRPANHPLVISNIGGQVRVGGLPSAYLFSIGGGTNWVLTGRYDPISKTGDAAFPGHRGNCYQSNQGSYGILVDDDWHGDTSGGVTELVSGAGRFGLSVGGGATNFELDDIEITRVTFAGLGVKTNDVPTATMDGVKLHDLYIHDVMSEGLYLGSTGTTDQQHVFTNLEIFNNRFLRTGSEAIQLGQLASARIHHNVSLHAALNWRHNFECTGQDNNVQYGQRYGVTQFDHNLVIGGAATLLIFFPQLVTSDPHQVGDGATLHDNLFATGRDMAVYTWELGGSSTYVVPNAVYAFQSNRLGDLAFSYADEYPGSLSHNVFFQFASNPTGNPFVLDGNTYDGTQAHASPNTNATAKNEQNGTVAPVAFNATGLPSDFDYRRFEFWSAYDSCYGQAGTGKPNPSGPPRTYAEGDLVMFDNVLYRLTAPSSSGERPDLTPSKWQRLGAPVDDVRLAKGSPYSGLGLLDTVH